MDIFQEQSYVWDNAISKIFPVDIPIEACWVEPDSMVRVLKEILKPEMMNHMFLVAEGGGMDLVSVWTDSGYLYLDVNTGRPYAVKPEYMKFFSFKNPLMDCFYIKSQKLSPLSSACTKCREYVVKTETGFITEDTFMKDYPDIDIDDDKAMLKSGFMKVLKYFDGGFLIMPKMGPYNQLYKNSYDPVNTGITYNYLSSIYKSLIP